MADAEPEGLASDGEEWAVCVRCEEKARVSACISAGRSGLICKLCYNAQRALKEYYKKRGQKDVWDSYPMARKKKLIIENKFAGGVKGKSREVKLLEEAGPT